MILSLWNFEATQGSFCSALLLEKPQNITFLNASV